MGPADVVEPARHLVAPGAPAEFHSPLEVLNQAGDLISPAFWMAEICDVALGFQPMDEAKEYFAGDWETYAKCAQVWERLGSTLGDVSRNIGAGRDCVDSTWDGNAADAARAYFDGIAGRCDGLQAELDALGTQYKVISHGVWSAAEAVGAVLSGIADAAAMAAISAAAGTMTSWTGWGAAVGYGAAALEIARIVELWGEATQAVNAAQRLVNAALGAVEQAGGGLATAFHDVPLPGAAYDNPAVGPALPGQR
ncbi:MULTISPECIES: hypothetical protein [unclassified Streptomyces]|uniref:hypothetical protein n=1 Tax=unclassified Streptomyces TaxID=2593676 RepID=UPI0037F7A021